MANRQSVPHSPSASSPDRRTPPNQNSRFWQRFAPGDTKKKKIFLVKGFPGNSPDLSAKAKQGQTNASRSEQKACLEN